MENINLIDSFAEFKEFKNIDRATLMRVLEDIFRNMLLKRYGTDENFDIIINIDKGDLEIWRNRTVVEDDKLENPNSEITLTEAKKIDEDYELGEEVTDEVKFKDFGRRSVLALRQNLSARILELEKDNVYNKYKDKAAGRACTVQADLFSVHRPVHHVNDKEIQKPYGNHKGYVLRNACKASLNQIDGPLP